MGNQNTARMDEADVFTANRRLEMGALIRPGRSPSKAGANPEHVKEGL